MNIKLTDPKLFLTFEGNDLEPGHSTSQTIESDYIINYSFSVRQQYLSSLKSASDQIGLQIKRKCASIEDIIATDGNVKAILKDGEETIFTGYIATSYKWTVADHGEQTLSITIEGVGTRLLNQPFIETGKHFFDCSASAAVYSIVHPLGITIHEGDERKILQNVGKEVEAGDTCRDLLDALFYECNAVYWFNNLGELCIDVINPSTIGVQTVDSADLYVVGAEAVSLSKSLRSYKGARITYKALGSAGGYLVYRNTTGATATRVCNLELKAGEYFDGAGIYTAAEWSDITADTFREPTLIGAVNAASESQIVGSGKIVNIANLSPDVVADTGIDVTFEAAGGPYIKMLAHNTTGSTKTITRMDLYADVVYEMSDGVIRTQIDGSTAGKTLLEEELTWIHDKENASKHANLLSQYYQYASATYTFRTKKDITPGSVIRLHEDLFSGLDVYVLITARDLSAGAEIWKYTAVGISNFDLAESAYHGTTEPAKQSGAQGPAGEPGATAEVQYAIGDSAIDPPGDVMTWLGMNMLWSSEEMNWNIGTWEESVPDQERGQYIWMRVRVGDAPWQYTRLTGSTAWDAENLGVRTTECPRRSKEGLDLVNGDYFVAGATFVDPVDGFTYLAGVAYEYYNGEWGSMDLTNPNNANKALDLLGALSTSQISIPQEFSSYGSMWIWTQNLVAWNAVIANLVSRNLQVGDGNGSSGSGFRFRAQAYDSTGAKLTNPIFDIYYGDAVLFSVDILTGKIYFGTGFYYDPSDVSIHSTGDGVVIDGSGQITVNNGLYKSNLVCPSFRSLPRETPITPTSYTISGSASSQYSQMGNISLNNNVNYPCTHSLDASIKYLRKSYGEYTFYSQSMSILGSIYMTESSLGPSYYSTWAGSTFTLNIGSSSDAVFKLLDTNGNVSIPLNAGSEVEKGELYYTSDGTVHIKLT